MGLLGVSDRENNEEGDPCLVDEEKRQEDDHVNLEVVVLEDEAKDDGGTDGKWKGTDSRHSNEDLEGGEKRKGPMEGGNGGVERWGGRR